MSLTQGFAQSQGAPGTPIEEPTDYNQYIMETFTGQPIYWPTRGLPKYDIRYENVTLDAVRVTRTYFIGPINLMSNPIQGWQQVDHSKSRFSMLFFMAADPNVRLGMTVLPKANFMPEYSKEALGHYAKGLLMRKPKNTSVFITSDINQPRDRRDPTVIGNFPLTIEYKIVDDTGERATRRVRDYFVEYEDMWIAFSYNAVEEQFDSSLPAVHYLFAFLAIPSLDETPDSLLQSE